MVEELQRAVYKMGRLHRDDPVVLKTKELIDNFRPLLPLVNEVANPAMQDRHWSQ
ncbi:dynein heavy chain, partial [Haematococcus lacustris]